MWIRLSVDHPLQHDRTMMRPVPFTAILDTLDDSADVVKYIGLLQRCTFRHAERRGGQWEFGGALFCCI